MERCSASFQSWFRSWSRSLGLGFDLGLRIGAALRAPTSALLSAPATPTQPQRPGKRDPTDVYQLDAHDRQKVERLRGTRKKPRDGRRQRRRGRPGWEGRVRPFVSKRGDNFDLFNGDSPHQLPVRNSTFSILLWIRCIVNP